MPQSGKKPTNKSKRKSGDFLRRYTDLPAVIYLLRNRRLTLLDPETWDDKNDSHFLELYRQAKQLGSVLALCFSQNAETYHHWRVFAPGSSGVCISFRREPLLAQIRKIRGTRVGEVKYIKMNQTRDAKSSVDSLPFLKRFPYEPEKEFRAIFESRNRLASFDIPISLSCIDKLTLSPWLHNTLTVDVRQMLQSIRGCSELRVSRSTLISNEDWKTFGERIATPAENQNKKRPLVRH